MEGLKEIGNLIKTQDNRITEQPLFVVQRRMELVCPEGYGDGSKWLCPDEEFIEADEVRSARLDALENGYRETGKWEKFHYHEHWEFVTACFTEQGCEDYIKRDGHNLGKTRIYAYGSYRNVEYQTVRKHLMNLAEQPTPAQ